MESYAQSDERIRKLSKTSLLLLLPPSHPTLIELFKHISWLFKKKIKKKTKVEIIHLVNFFFFFFFQYFP